MCKAIYDILQRMEKTVMRFVATMLAGVAGSFAGFAETLATPEVVSVKDAAKIKSWDAWNERLAKKTAKFGARQQLCGLDCGLEPSGVLEVRCAGDEAMQYVFSYFDEDVHPVSETRQTVNGKDLVVARFERQSNPVYVLWFSGERPADMPAYEKGDVVLEQYNLWDPVWVDLLTGKVCKFPKANIVRKGARTTVKGVPLWDSPVMLTANSQVPRQTDWPNMKPAEIVDALYRPHQGLQIGRNGRPRKMDVTNEPWAKMVTKDFLPCFDKYGQFKWRDWPGKTHSDEELKAAGAAEEKDLAAHPGPKGRDRFGGWADGPKQKATGRFRTAKVDGKWWLVDPEGNLFWSWGPVRVTPSSAMTPLNGNPRSPMCGGAMPDRDCLFSDLPKKGEPLAQFYDTYDALLLPFYLKRGQTRRFDFSAANLYRKYGERWFEKYSDSCHRRLRSWGCNTIANSSDLKICLQDRTPYAERVEVASRPIAGSWGAWFKFRDPFDPSFRTACLAALAEHGREAHDSWCIGFFIDNEIQWGAKHEDLARWTLWSPDDQPAKIEFVKRLADKGIVWDGDMDKVPAVELRAFTDVIVEEYFKRTRAALKEFDPGLLYLGCRFANAARPWAVKACVKYCDVVSYNIYADTIRDWRLPEGLDAPVMIGEFHFGAHDRGLFGASLVNKESQEGRAAALKAYVESALANPQIVGVHWHQFSDQATSGRFDGEYFQVGWTDICDKPYPETVAAVRAVGYALYPMRFVGACAALLAGCATVNEPAPETLIAHRGESVDAPENTLPAYKMAVSRGFGFECDIYLSADKRLFTFHDLDLARTTAGVHTEKCIEASWDKTVSKVNVGGWGKWKGSAFDPTRPALLEEVLALARDGRQIYVEVKGNEPDWAPHIKAVFDKQTNANSDNVRFITFGDKIAKALKKTMGDYKLYFLLSARPTRTSKPWTADEIIAKLREIGADGVDIRYDPQVHDAAFVKKVRDAGYEFHVWTIDSLEKAERAFAAGAQTVTTNCAKKLLDDYRAKRALKAR